MGLIALASSILICCTGNHSQSVQNTESVCNYKPLLSDTSQSVQIAEPTDDDTPMPPDTVIFIRQWKNPSVYLMGKPSESKIDKWKKLCETKNAKMNRIENVPYMTGKRFNDLIAFGDFVETLYNPDIDIPERDAFVLWRLNEYMPDMSNLFREEFEKWQKYSKAAAKAFDKIEIGPDAYGSSLPMAINGFDLEIAELMTEALIPFYLKLSDPEYCPIIKVQTKQTDNSIDAEYRKFESYLKLFEYGYPLEERRQALKADQKAWQVWMAARRKVSQSLEGELKDFYDECTNNLLRRKLIDLKNRYCGYGCAYPESLMKVLLPYDCTDNELNVHFLDSYWSKD